MTQQSLHLNQGFTLIEVLVSLALLSGSYWVIVSSQQFVSSYTFKLEREFVELIEIHNQHELEMALLDWSEE
jgi:prepilin-type N-terminal cleavage/methylation domain-containing protein